MTVERAYPMVWRHGIAEDIDGQWRFDRQRPATNPDRHARIRAKHFHHAHRMQTERCQSYLLEAAFEYDVFKGGDDWDAAWASEDNRRDSSVAAFENCAWGVS